MTPPTLRSRRAWTELALCCGLYALACAELFDWVGYSIGALGTLPTIWFGWRYGQRGGVLSALLVLSVTFVVFFVKAPRPWPLFLRESFFGSVVLLLVGSGSGWVSTLLARVRQQAEQLRAESARLAAEIERRERVQAALRLIQTAVEDASDAIAILCATRHGPVVMYANPAFQRLTPPDAGGWLSDLWQTIQSSNQARGEITAPHAQTTLEWHVTPMNERSRPHWVVVLRDVGERKRWEAELRRLAYTDALTGLANRVAYMERLQRALEMADQQVTPPPTVIFTDLDGFKQINDTYGHTTGDRLLRAVAARIRDQLDEEDLAARLSGDEFVVLTHGRERAAMLAARLLQALGEPYRLADQTILLSASIGVATADDLAAGPGDPAARASALLRAADHAMYRAKSAGKSCWRRAPATATAAPPAAESA